MPVRPATLLEAAANTLLRGAKKVAARAVGMAGQSIARDIAKAGADLKARGEAAAARIEKDLLGGDDE